MSTPLVSIALLTNSKPELLREVLGSIVGQDYPAVEPIVVLNGPHPGIEAIVAEFPAVRLVKNDRNRGFAPGMNQGVRESRGEYVYITANDIVLAPNYISELVRAAEAAPGWGVSSGVWRNQSSAEKEVIAAGGDARFTAGGLRVAVRTTVENPTTPYDTDWVPGAGIFCRKAVWEAVGGYREEFFFHVEDVELCVRVRRAGGYVRVVPTAVLYHHEHPNGVSQNPTIEYHKLKNYLAVNALHGPLPALPWLCLKYFGHAVPRIARHLRSPRFLLRTWWDSLTHLPRWLAERRGFRTPFTPPPVTG